MIPYLTEPSHGNMELINKLLLNGVRIACIDISSGNLKDHEKLLNTIRSAVQDYSDQVGIITPFTIAVEITHLRIRTGKLKDVIL